MRIGLVALSVVLLSAASGAAAEMVWRSTGAEGGHAAHGGDGGRRRGGGLLLEDGEGVRVEQWSPTLERRMLAADRAGYSPAPTGMDNYHALVATRGGDTAVRYVYLRGKPSGRSPADLFEASKARFEIVPTPYAREHARYTSGREAVFAVRFDGAPVAAQTVALETSNGTRRFVNTDADGIVRFELPEDFAEVRPGRENNPAAEFVVSATTTAAGEPHRFALSADYHVNPRHWQSLNAGLASALAGFAFGLGFVRFARRSRPVKG